MNINDIIEYVMNTPQNTNKAVLSSMLTSLDTTNTNNEITYVVPPQRIALVENDFGVHMGVLSNVDFSNVNDKDFLLFKILTGPNEDETYDDEDIASNLYTDIEQYSESSNTCGFENTHMIFMMQQFDGVWVCAAYDASENTNITGIIEVTVEKFDISNIVDAIGLEPIVSELPQIDMSGGTDDSNGEEIPRP